MKPSRRSFAIYAALLAVILLALPACVGRVNRSVDEDRRGVSARFFDSREEAQIDKARALRLEGEYNEAIDTLLAVYRNRAFESKYRAEALLELSHVHSHLMNPEKDYDAALRHLNTLITEFPESSLRAEAEEKTEHIKKLQAAIEQN